MSFRYYLPWRYHFTSCHQSIPYDNIVDFYERTYEKVQDVDKRFDRLDWILAQLIEYGGEDKFIKANQLIQNLMQMSRHGCRPKKSVSKYP